VTDSFSYETQVKQTNFILQASGFKSVATMSRGHPYFDLWAVASKEELNEEHMQALAMEHMTPV
jgi:hypothetical protein